MKKNVSLKICSFVHSFSCMCFFVLFFSFFLSFLKIRVEIKKSSLLLVVVFSLLKQI